MYSKRKQAVTRRVLTWLNSRHWSHRTAIALIYWLARLFLPSCCRQGYRRTAQRLRNCLGIWTPRYCCAVQTLPKRSEEHTSELQSLMRISYAVFCLNKKKNHTIRQQTTITKQHNM